MKVAVIIPAAGASTRFGGRSKCDEDLGGRPLLQRTVELFVNRPEVATIMVNKDVDRFPVVRDGVLVGFITQGDIVRRVLGG